MCSVQCSSWRQIHNLLAAIYSCRYKLLTCKRITVQIHGCSSAPATSLIISAETAAVALPAFVQPWYMLSESVQSLRHCLIIVIAAIITTSVDCPCTHVHMSKNAQKKCPRRCLVWGNIRMSYRSANLWTRMIIRMRAVCDLVLSSFAPAVTLMHINGDPVTFAITWVPHEPL